MKRTVLALAILLLASAAVAQTERTPRVIDLAGVSHVIETVPERVIAVGPGALRMLIYMEQIDRVVAVEEFEFGLNPYLRPYFAAYREELSRLPRFHGSGHGGPLDMEAIDDIAATAPDAVIVCGLDEVMVERMRERLHVPVITIAYGVTLGRFEQQALASLRVLGRVFNNSERAEELIDTIRSIEDDLASRVAKTISPRVYVGGVAWRGPRGFESTEAGFPPLALVEGLNIANMMGVREHVTADRQDILDAAPQVLFIDLAGYDIVKKQVAEDPAYFKNIPAVKNGRVFLVVPYNSYNTNIESVYLSAYFIGKILHPLAFSDIDPEKTSARISTVFLGRSICGILDELATACDPISLLPAE